MTKKESAERVLKHGDCTTIACTDCFIPRGDYDDPELPECEILLRNILSKNIKKISKHSPFRARIIAAKYLADLEEADD